MADYIDPIQREISPLFVSTENQLADNLPNYYHLNDFTEVEEN